MQHASQQALTAAKTIEHVRETFQKTRKGIQGKVSEPEADHLAQNAAQREQNVIQALQTPSVLQDNFNAESMHEALTILLERFEKLAFRNDIAIPDEQRQEIADILKSKLEQNANALDPQHPDRFIATTLYHGTDILRLKDDPAYQDIPEAEIIKTALANPVAPVAALDREISQTKPLNIKIGALQKSIRAMSQDPKQIDAPEWALTNKGDIPDEDIADFQALEFLKTDPIYSEIPPWAFEHVILSSDDSPEDTLETINDAIDDLRENPRYENLPNWAIILSAIHNPNAAEETLDHALETAHTFEQDVAFERLSENPEIFLYAALQQPNQDNTFLNDFVATKEAAPQGQEAELSQ